MPLENPVQPAITRRLRLPKPNTVRLWTFQPLHVWHALQEQGTLWVNPDHPEFIQSTDGILPAYDWLRKQMAKRIPGYAGHYPWWAYEHFLDLRFYRWVIGSYPERLMRLELAIPTDQVLLSAYGSWHSVLGRDYLPQALVWEDYERESDAWEEAAGIKWHFALQVPNVLYPEPWETQMQTSWERVFDVDARRPRETIQATFERMDLTDVIKVTEFTAMPER